VDSAGTGSLLGWISFLAGDDEGAIRHFRDALKIIKSATRRRKIYFSSPAGLFFIFALLRTRDRSGYREAKGYVDIVLADKSHYLYSAYYPLGLLLPVLQGELAADDAPLDLLAEPGAPMSLAAMLAAARRKGYPRDPAADRLPGTFEILVRALVLFWAGVPAVERVIPELKTLYRRAQAGGYRWIELEAADLLARLDVPGYAEQAAPLRKEIATQPLATVVQREEPWERSLAALLDLAGAGGKKQASPSASRLVWRVAYYGEGCTLRPVEQRCNAKGVWSKGRAVALKRLHEDSGSLGCLTPQDAQVCSSINSYYQRAGYYDRYGQTFYDFDYDRALPALVGHPLVFLEEDPGVRVEVVRGEPVLSVKQSGSELTLELSPRVPAEGRVVIAREGPTRLRVVELTEHHHRLGEILNSGLKLPVGAQPVLQEALAGLASLVTVHSDVGAEVPEAAEVTPDPTPRVQLLPRGNGFRAQILVRPFGTEGPYYRPGAGGHAVIAEIQGKRVQTQRDLAAEQQGLESVVAECPILARVAGDDHGWVLEDLEDCLEFLVELQALGERAVVEWPEGRKLEAPKPASPELLKLRVRRDRDWFQADGELRVDDALVLDLRELLELSAATSRGFIALAEGQFLALTESFVRRLEEFRAIAEPHGKGLRFHPLASLALDDFADEVGSFRADKEWKTLLDRVREAQALEPAVPTTLQTELRPYQIDGYQWLARMAHWGAGACLADDMGLGKTIQALALLLTRAPGGPSLVVAPTSVCMNWGAEAARYAPTLNVVNFGSGDRQKALDSLQPFDLVIAIYGLLLYEVERLAAVPWESVVLDEAQAIKNFAAKRSRAAMELEAGFKVITTGTPIENHLGELWNLFRFLNPGLLGSLEGFNRRFAVPIEKGRDAGARSRLKRLIQPFMLRRTKSQVLDDLPPRTEIMHSVELSQKEAALYESLRRQALDRLDQTAGPAGQRHLQVLAEIMRLRRACCNARLVLPDSRLPSSKLEAFGEILEELLANRHKALVFSQFVDHLTIVREFLDRGEVSYQYLDGATPARQRKARVDAFQAGEGDLFLISLRAGGQGLNLTAADYVIHLDPWWNPAVEDQASDRAHRIGQRRPVTIYRLVAKGTIEEKIVELHHHKRDLADGLLEGTDLGGKLSAEELLQVLREA
jgi:hypothetical protein